eukprot:Skav233266  [mRNA]  locus=scaffold4476:65219:74481:- [translate_table: standard]
MEASRLEKVSVESVETVEDESKHRAKIRVQTIFAELLVTAAASAKTSEVGCEAFKLAQTDRPLPKCP